MVREDCRLWGCGLDLRSTLADRIGDGTGDLANSKQSRGI